MSRHLTSRTILDSLYSGEIAETAIDCCAMRNYVSITEATDEIERLCLWMKKRGLNEGVPNHELIDESGNVIGILDLAWPRGIQNGLSERIAILLNETADVQATVRK